MITIHIYKIYSKKIKTNSSIKNELLITKKEEDQITSGHREEEGVARAGNTDGISTSMAKYDTIFE
jgi:hypothetical protein